jgi:putative FmdB family regulatory protein
VPTYEYRCRTCGHQLETVQSFTDDALTTCGECGGPLRKVFGTVGIAFKGTGFYKNDSRGKKASVTTGADKAGGDKAAGDGASATKDNGAGSKKDAAASSSSSGASDTSAASTSASASTSKSTTAST